MTSQNSENNNRSSSSSSTPVTNNNNSILGQSILMKEKDRNKINNNNNILLLNQTSITSNFNVNFKTQSTPTFVQIKPTTSSSLSSSDQSTKNSTDDCLFDSDIEIIDDYEDGSKDQKLRKKNADTDSPVRKLRNSNKKETPLLQIFDGNVVISQELSIEEVQNLLTQINSRLQNQNSVNSADFPNITFSKEENSDIEIILDDTNDIELNNKNEDNAQAKILTGTKSGKWIGQTFDSNKSKVLLKSLSVGDKTVAELYDQPSTSSESNLLIAFKSFSDRKSESGTSGFEHDYSSQKLVNDDVNSKEDEPMVEHVIVENAGTELMQIELIEPANGPATGNGSSNCATDKGKSVFSLLLIFLRVWEFSCELLIM